MRDMLEEATLCKPWPRYLRNIQATLQIGWNNGDYILEEFLVQELCKPPIDEQKY